MLKVYSSAKGMSLVFILNSISITKLKLIYFFSDSFLTPLMKKIDPRKMNIPVKINRIKNTILLLLANGAIHIRIVASRKLIVSAKQPNVVRESCIMSFAPITL